MKKILFILIIFQAISSYCQNGTIKGKVLDKQSELPLLGASVELLLPDKLVGVITDFDGYFTLENVPIGRQEIRVSYIGYETNTISNIEVSTGKDINITVALTESFAKLDEVVLTSSTSKVKSLNKFSAVSARQFGVKEVGRYAGGRNDVARLASNFAGVASPDDSRNDIVVRGNSPTGLLWRVEGIPIPSPNHFSALGTTGSPVSALNPNLLKNSDFITSAFPAEYGNAIGGVFDLGFRNGNKDEYEYSFQMGAFTGLEGTAEGPLNKKNNGSFLVAARYSLIGLIGGAGTSDTPNYADVSYNINLGKTKLGTFSLFGIMGTSSIDLIGEDYDEDDLFSAEDENSYVSSTIGVLGAKHLISIGESSYLKTVIAGAFNNSDYEEDRIIDLDTDDERIIRYAESNNEETRFTFSTLFNTKINNKLTLRTGLLLENFSTDLNRKERDEQEDGNNDGDPDLVTIRNINGSYNVFQPYVQTKYRLTETLTLNTGIHTMFSDLNKQFVVEPRASMSWQIKPQHAINIGYGIHHQNVPTPLLFLSEEVNGETLNPNEDLDFVRSQHYVLGYDFKLTSSWRAKIEAYYQRIDNAAIDETPSSYSSLTEGADFTFSSDNTNLVSSGTGENKGLELTLEKSFSKGFHALITSSLFESTYKGSDDIQRSTPFDNGYIVNFLAGKEYKIGKQKKNIFSVDARFVSSGGKYYTPVDLEASQNAGYEILQDDLAFSQQYDDYMRLDLKLGFTLNSNMKKTSHKFYIDLQNITNRDNVFIRQYNRITNNVDQINQAGFFPDFGYRFQF
ncbi:Outer membrane receptor proteins, mostly Fe transport [Maribacter dokdonensis]|uniref:Outer membrane receptor proteins, mostly Fe transport n=1 Tax=Maribacter dokdonensis TaxID=320912 RepID=A0ABY0UMW5_9FLAO|nr:TonB-dependent receptor [Maribacter dokdonensis]SDS92288.1 Outer membrane receptor proteins, mostly Fe transport [Maribacter dokdonensis]